MKKTSNIDASHDNGISGIEKTKTTAIREIYSKIKGTAYHEHEDRPVPEFCLNTWSERGYNPHKKGVLHVRFMRSRKKYVFPLYFWMVKP